MLAPSFDLKGLISRNRYKYDMKLQKCITQVSLKQLIRNFQDLFFILKQSSLRTFLIFTTVALTPDRIYI